MVMQMLILALGFALLVKGADLFVEGAAGIADKLRIPQLIIGLTIVAMGTSLPEAGVSISAALAGNSGIAVGNVVGSNILNILLILGVTAMITNVAIQKTTMQIEIPFMIGLTLLLAVFGRSGGGIGIAEGLTFLVLFACFLGYLYGMARKNQAEGEKAGKILPVWQCVLGMALGGVFVVKGSEWAVDAATAIARLLGLSERFIGLTIVALGTSLPELVTSVTAAVKGNAGIAIGNIVGSNIFNILFILGVSSVICEIPFEPDFLVDTLIAVGSGVMLLVGTVRHRELRRGFGAVMLLAYALYFAYLL